MPECDKPAVATNADELFATYTPPKMSYVDGSGMIHAFMNKNHHIKRSPSKVDEKKLRELAAFANSDW
jgi:hypothetical protein